KFTICLNPRVADELDLAVAKDVYNAVPQVGGQSVFTVTVTNLSATISATNVEIEDVLDANLVYQYSTESAGSYDSSTGIWSIPIILPSHTVTMDMTVTVNGSADNIASLKSLDQTDTNPNNNEDMVSVTVSGSSGGNSGGLESNGSLAAKIAVRNFKRSKTDQKNIFSQPSEMVMFSEELAQNRVITAESQLKGGTNLAELFPEEGPFGSKAYVSTPEDLLGITNAEEVFAVDYYDSGDKRLGAILALTTLNGEVYSHTKMVCDRMSGGSLDMVRTVQIDSKNFIMSKLVQASGDVDYAISFITWEEDGVMMIDNRWNIADYQPADNASIHNFQVWSVTSQSTIKLTKELLARLAEDNKLSFVNADNQAPATYAANGYYENGNIMINLKTNGQADNLHIQGNLTRNEGAIREPFSYDISIPAKSEGLVNIEIPVGNIFDAGFSLRSSLLEISDALYFADGPWGNSFEDDGAWINSFATEPYDGQQFADSYLLERNAEMSGQVRTYASLFRAMKAGNQAVDLTGYNILEFDASGSGLVELIVAKASIEHWSDQARTSFNLTSNEQTYRIDLSQLKASLANASFSANDVLSVAFNLIGDGQNWQDFSISIKNLRFAKGSSDQILTDQDIIQMKAYPNPVSDMATIEFSIPETNNVHIALYDITGKEVQVLADQEFSFGTHRLQLSAADLSNGMYFMKLRYNHQVESQRISVLK
ncbi:MAG: T9SS type A sorting domain-containing protein, partial [Bacteroidales bacterium]|nr:T9SS type A sorting domain-containing protein [Bacteroidales bacterium]